ncbi:MAG: transglutaminase domain-containing protein [Ginsengibacter sp.]
MKRPVILLLICAYTVITQSQILNIPDSQTNTTKEIATYINSRFNNGPERIRAIYSWVTSNIKYDADSIHRVIIDEDNDQRITYALKRKKGVCENFAAIFTGICIESGIPSFAIEGYTRQNGKIDKAPHVWCAAFIESKWFLYDPTWDAGSISGGHFVRDIRTNYFQKTPDEMIRSHLPFDPLFQFLDYPVTYKEFVGNNFPVGKGSYFNYTDSLEVYRSSDPLSRYMANISRIKRVGWPASLIEIKLKRVRFEIELIREERDMELYNSAIVDYNSAVAVLNHFLNYRNNPDQSVIPQNKVQESFDLIKEKIKVANRKLKEVNLSTATILLNTGDIQKKLDDLAAKVKEQEAFSEKL